MQNYMKMRDQYAYLARQSTWGGGLTRRLGGSQGGVAATSPGRIRLADGEEYSTRRPLVEQLHKKGIQDVLTVIYGRISRVSNERQCFLRCALQAHQEGKNGRLGEREGDQLARVGSAEMRGGEAIGGRPTGLYASGSLLQNAWPTRGRGH